MDNEEENLGEAKATDPKVKVFQLLKNVCSGDSMIQNDLDTLEPGHKGANKNPDSDYPSSAQSSSKTVDSGMFSKAEKMETRTEETSLEVPKTALSTGASNSGDVFVELVTDWGGAGFDVECNVTVEKNGASSVSESNVGSVEEVAGDNCVATSGSTSLPLRRLRNRLRNYRQNRICDTSSESEVDSVPLKPSTTNQNDPDASSSTVRDTVADVDATTNSLSGGENSNELHPDRHNMSIPQHRSDDESSNSTHDDDDDEDDDDDDDDNDDDDDEDEDGEADVQDYNDEASPADETEIKDVLNKPKPSYTWNSIYELMRREHGLSFNGDRSLKNGMSSSFNSRFYSSRHVIERMKFSQSLAKHHGCVNCLNFNRTGELLCTGSDDTRIIVWNWAQNKAKHDFKSGHTENIFQAKFIDSIGCLDIVSASRDGQVRRSFIPPSGGKVKSSCLYKHHDSVHKLVICPQSVHEIISVGEDGYIRHKDLRSDNKASEMLKVVTGRKSRKVRLFSVSHHPFAPEICVCGCDNLVRVYDKRNMAKSVHEMCPEHLIETSIPQVTCSVYNNTGSEILSSYSEDHIYLFNNKEYKTGEYLHRYRGHYNHKTIKGVNFFGPNSEYIISGSDCGNIFFWDKNTEAILNLMVKGDTAGVVNCLEPHPSIPVLATSGLDHDIKIWTPSSDKYPPDLSKLEFCVQRNLRRSLIDTGSVFDDRQFHYFIRQFLRRPQNAYEQRSEDNDDPNSDVVDGQMWSSSSSSSSSSEDEYPQLEGIHCRTQ